MFIRALRNPATFNAEDGGSSSSDDLDVKIAAAVERATTGLKAKNDELLGELKAERSKRTALEGQVRELGSDDINKVRDFMEKMQADADLRMIVEGGKAAFEEVLVRRTKSIITDERRKVELAEQAAREAVAKAEQAQNKWRSERLNHEVMSAVTKAKALPEASEFITMKAESLFVLDDETGKARLRDGIDSIDRNGNPHTLDTWVESLRDTNPFFFGITAGGGANGGANGQANGRAPVRIDPTDARAVGANLEAIAKGKAVLAT